MRRGNLGSARPARDRRHPLGFSGVSFGVRCRGGACGVEGPGAHAMLAVVNRVVLSALQGAFVVPAGGLIPAIAPSAFPCPTTERHAPSAHSSGNSVRSSHHHTPAPGGRGAAGAGIVSPYVSASALGPSIHRFVRCPRVLLLHRGRHCLALRGRHCLAHPGARCPASCCRVRVSRPRRSPCPSPGRGHNARGADSSQRSSSTNPCGRRGRRGTPRGRSRARRCAGPPSWCQSAATPRRRDRR